MSVPARWTLRLPRTACAQAARSSSSLYSATKHRATQQTRWLAQRPPPRARPWAAPNKPSHDQRPQSTHPSDGRPGEAGPSQEVQRMPEASRQQQQAAEQQHQGRNTALAATLQQADTSDLVTDVRIPADLAGVLEPGHPALSILGNSSLVIQRQIEMMNLMIGFEQANRYIIMDGDGNTLGYIAEQDHGIGRTMARQVFKTHRSFTTHIFDKQEREVLRIHRPFAYINSRIRIYDPVPEGGYEEMHASTAIQGLSTGSVTDPSRQAHISPLKLEEMRIIGEAQQQWAPLRRKYNLFTFRPLGTAPEQDSTPRIESGDTPNTETTALTEAKVPERAIEAGMAQFAHVNEPFLSWDFGLRDESNNLVGSVNRNFAGFAREIFTDTGVYALRMDSAAQASVLENAQGQEVTAYEREATAMTLDQRAVMLATAVSIDFDYFSRHSHAGHGGFMPLWWPMGGGAAAEGAGAGAGAAGAGAGAAEAGAAEAAGTAVEGAAGAAGTAGRGLAGAAAGESAIAGAGTMAGYEAMQRGVYGSRGGADDASPTANEPAQGAQSSSPVDQQQPNDDVWGEGKDPWSEGGDDGWPGDGPPPSAGGEGGGGGGGWMDSISEFFSD